MRYEDGSEIWVGMEFFVSRYRRDGMGWLGRLVDTGDLACMIGWDGWTG